MVIKTISTVKLGNIINVSINGKLYRKTFYRAEDADNFYLKILEVKDNPTDENINSLIFEINRNRRIAYLNNFEIDPNTNEIFLAGFNTPIPSIMIDIIDDYNKNGYPLDPIINFWKLLMMNPDKRIHNSIFKFIKEYDFSITDFGYLIVYKAVHYNDSLDNNFKLDEFISNAYLKVKYKWKSNPKNYIVYKNINDDVFSITKIETINSWDLKEKNIEIIGNLYESYNQILNKKNEVNSIATNYTDMYTKTMNIQIGVPVKIARELCDSDPQNSCSSGLHVGATKYVEYYADNNSVILVCLVNPMNIVEIPNNETSKMRVCEYYPFAVANFENNKIDIIEQKYFEFDYRNYELKDLELMIEKINLNEQQVSNFNYKEYNDNSLYELKKVIESRILDLY